MVRYPILVILYQVYYIFIKSYLRTILFLMQTFLINEILLVWSLNYLGTIYLKINDSLDVLQVSGSVLLKKIEVYIAIGHSTWSNYY